VSAVPGIGDAVVAGMKCIKAAPKLSKAIKFGSKVGTKAKSAFKGVAKKPLEYLKTLLGICGYLGVEK